MLKSSYEEVIINPPVVVDNGSGVMKAGFAGDEVPKCCFPSFVGRPKHQRVMAGAVEGDVFVGNRAEDIRGLLSIRYPMTHGIIVDWVDMENVWMHMFSELKIHSEEHPALLSEAPLNPMKNREKISEVFFETFNSPAIFISPQAVLSLYSSGRTTGVVLDSGDGVTHVVPIYSGFSSSHAVTRSDVAGRDITYYLSLLLRKAGYIFHTSAEMEIVKYIKETACYISFNPAAEEPSKKERGKGISGYPIKLPDGTDIVNSQKLYFYTLELPLWMLKPCKHVKSMKDRVDLSISFFFVVDTLNGRTLHVEDNLKASGDVRFLWYISQVGDERYHAPEILFHPSIIGQEYPGIHELLVTAIQRCDMDLRKPLYSQIVLSGGSTLFAGFGDRLLNEIRKMAPKDVKIRISAPPERKFTTWVGGSILASLSSFKTLWVSKQEYEEDGIASLHRKTF
ncbi:actin-related protein ARP1 [Cardiosporidium cionae]|uniref:Actin-related protein ARP1 n=1 Tax=Cardiosporidium cionae TaxID=476202 RepID=A0ABQ7JAY3_9APIC|nr:actin-related protein ARP1 [Cardiosporidium cionae]|eukprot:KAF8821162.1 actin-related protein ARP1 [Cardiosporidium cionae]